MQILFSVLCYIFFVSPCFNYCSLWWQSKVSCILSLSFYSGCKSPLCCKQCFQNHSTLFPPICYHTECWALQYCAFNSNLICSSLSDVNFALVIPFFLARWLQCKQHYISWLLIPDYTIEIANNVRVIKIMKQDPWCYSGCLVAWLVLLWTALGYIHEVSSIDFFKGKERLAEALRLSHEIFRALKLPTTITLWIQWIFKE